MGRRFVLGRARRRRRRNRSRCRGQRLRRGLRLDTDGKAEVFATGLRGASGNAFGPDGDRFQSNIGGNTISRISPEGEVSLFLTGGLSAPVGIAIDEEGTLFVANCGSDSIVEVSPEGDSRVFASSPLLACPNGIALDLDHNLYVSNFNNGDVIKITPFAEVTRLATLPGNNNGHLSTFSFPNGIAVGPDARTFYVNENASVTEPNQVLAPMIVRRIRAVADETVGGSEE